MLYAGWQHRGQHATRDAAIVRSEILERLERMCDDGVREVVIVGAACERDALLTFFGHRRNTSVRRIDDERGLTLRHTALTGGPV
jgi:hypothetical protein